MSKAADRSSQVIALELVRGQRALVPRLAQLVAYTAEGPCIHWEGSTSGPAVARSTIEASVLHRAIGQEVLVVFAGERTDEPVIVGVVQPVVAPAPTDVEASVKQESKLPSEALVDGQRVVIRGAQEISFECGESSLVMRANGRIVVRGVYVETRARGVNRIRGGSVKIN